MVLEGLSISSGPLSGYENMAADDLLMSLAASGAISFAVRIFGWMPACVSFGRLQKPCEEADLAGISAEGADLVRRPTGGRAVWHESEITYSVIAGPGHPLQAGGILDSLSMTGGALLHALGSCGIDASMTPRTRASEGRSKGNPCFASHGACEITWGGRKLVGSAQARRDGVFLEHGSILLRNDQPRLLPFLRSAPGMVAEHRSAIAERTCSISDIAPSCDRKGLERALEEALSALAGFPLRCASMEDLPRAELARMSLARRKEAEGWRTAEIAGSLPG